MSAYCMCILAAASCRSYYCWNQAAGGAYGGHGGLGGGGGGGPAALRAALDDLVACAGGDPHGEARQGMYVQLWLEQDKVGRVW